MAKRTNKSLDILKDLDLDLGGSLLPSQTEGQGTEVSEVVAETEVAKVVKSEEPAQVVATPIVAQPVVTTPVVQVQVEKSPEPAAQEKKEVKSTASETPIIQVSKSNYNENSENSVTSDEKEVYDEQSSNVRISGKVEDEFLRATEIFRDGNFALHVNLDEITNQRLNWAEQAIGFNDQRKSKRLVIAAMAKVFFDIYGKEIHEVIEKRMKEELKKMKGKR